MRTYIMVSALAALMTQAVYASHKGMQKRQVPSGSELDQCLTACLAQNGIKIDCSATSTGGNPAQCLCNPDTGAAIQSCLSEMCNIEGAQGLAQAIEQLCQPAVLPRDDPSGDSVSSANASPASDPLSGLLGLLGILGGGSGSL
ncbi:hypothetical protein C8Q70DRAFT_1002188 [Cubamyces menziesii]|nr:hypothetical protein C8Q70DRAFT_1002188 [Cubamyces menziesii]